MYTVSVQAADNRGGRDVQTYVLNVTTGQANHPPTITSQPVTSATATLAYQYQVVASDPDGDILSYHLTSPPVPGLGINTQTGLISWTPTQSQTSPPATNITVQVLDGRGEQATQSFTITVAPFSHVDRPSH